MPDAQETHEGLGSHTNIWKDVKVGDLVKGQTPVIVDSKLPVEEAASVLVKNGISSAPVFNSDSNSFAGMFDYQDLVSYILVVFRKDAWKQEEDDINIEEIIRRAFKAEPVDVKLVADLSHRNPFYSVTTETSLLHAMDIFGKGVHRVAVTEPTDSSKLVGVLTQSNVSNFLYGKVVTSPVAQKSIKDLSIIKSGDMKMINAQANVFTAMSAMREEGLSSLPLVDHGGHLVGSISLSDIKYVLRGFQYNMLWKTCFQFISHVRNHQGLEDGGRDRYPVFEVTEDDSLLKAIGKMGATKSHRVWVVDSQNKVIGVVSLTDALRVLTPAD